MPGGLDPNWGDSGGGSAPSGGSGEGTGTNYSAMGGVGGDVLSFIGSMLAQDASTKAAQFDMAQLDANAQLAGIAAADALRRGNYQAAVLRLKGDQLVSKQRAAYTSGGVDASVGTPADITSYTGTVAEMDAQTAENNAALEAWGYRKQKEGFGRQREQRLEQWKAQNTQYSLNQIGTIGKFGMDGMKAGSSGGGMGGG